MQHADDFDSCLFALVEYEIVLEALHRKTSQVLEFRASYNVCPSHSWHPSQYIKRGLSVLQEAKGRWRIDLPNIGGNLAHIPIHLRSYEELLAHGPLSASFLSRKRCFNESQSCRVVSRA